MNTAVHAPIFRRAIGSATSAAGLIDRTQAAFALAVRLYVACVFFMSGLTKIRDWNITLALFENEYHVPLLPSAWAAGLGTSAELALPVLLALGLGSRAAAIALFVFNIVAVVSYPELSDAGLKDHMLWGALMLVTFFYGPGRLSLDAWIAARNAR
jgi:putative oxidoreductase